MVTGVITGSVLIAAYLLGSIPTALIIARKIKGVDIRTVGDGNMGARNTFHTIGSRFGITVAIIDFIKGALAVLLAYILGLTLLWQFITGACVILGHDFPIFAGFKGGQGTATSLGTMLVLFPIQALAGLAVYGILYLITKKSQFSCGVGGGLIALLLGISQQWQLLIYAVAVFISIPIKLLIDTPRRQAIKMGKDKQLP